VLIERNCILLHGAIKSKSFEQVNGLLQARGCKTVSCLEWALWTDYYKTLAQDNPIYQKEIVCNNRSLAWFARDLKKKSNKDSLS
tara:strand:- start:679 stop:933 length:255 start_codon:yes stop_codon:yes gene_type:complete